jgi:hypothetical protein
MGQFELNKDRVQMRRLSRKVADTQKVVFREIGIISYYFSVNEAFHIHRTQTTKMT